MNRLEVERHALALEWSVLGHFAYSDLNDEAKARMDNTGMEGWRRHSLVTATDWSYEDLAPAAQAKIDAALALEDAQVCKEVSA